jgi:hypothetical protein
MSNSISIVVKEPNKKPEVRIIDGSLEEMQKIVGGYIEPVRVSGNIELFVNEDGLSENLPLNLYVMDTPLFGTIFAAAHNEEGDTISLTKNQITQMIGLLESWSD